MKKIFSIGLGLVVGLILCLLVGWIFKSGGTTTKTSSAVMYQFSGNRNGDFGSGGKGRFGSGMGGSGMYRGSGDFRRGTGFMDGSGNFMRGTGRKPSDTGTISAEELFNQDTLQQ